MKKRLTHLLLLLAALPLLCAPAQALLVVEATVTPIATGFHYDVAVDNATASDVSIVSIIDAPVGDPTISATLAGPAGFATSYDAGLGFIDLIESVELFGAGTRIDGFSFDSAFDASLLQFASFQALTTFGELLEGAVTILRPVVAVSEVGSSTLLAIGLLAFLALRSRRHHKHATARKPMRIAAASLALLGMGQAHAASHSDAPLIKQDPQANITDVYAFVGNKFGDPDTKVLNLVTSVRPLSEPGDGPHYDRFADDAEYSTTITNPFSGEPILRYNFRFSSVSADDPNAYKNTNTILSYGLGDEVGAIQTLGDARQNYTQTYTVTLTNMRDGTTTTVGTDIPTAVPNVGPRVTPAYNNSAGFAVSGAISDTELDEYTRQAILDLGRETVFAGSRDDGFYADIGGIFDLLDSRILDNNGDTGDGLGQDGNGVDLFQGYNVLSYAVQVPVEDLSAVPGFPLVGVYSSVSRPRIRLLRSNGAPRNLGPMVQVNRMGNPLFNEVFVGLTDKDVYNRAAPTDDVDKFREYAARPEIARLVNSVFGTNFPEDSPVFESIYTPDVLRVDTSTNPVPLPGDDKFSRLSFFGEDIVESETFGLVPGGWPNGRRFGDDVIDIMLTIASGAFTPGAPVVGDNVSNNDIPYNRVFPYAATPHSGTKVMQDPPKTPVW